MELIFDIIKRLTNNKANQIFHNKILKLIPMFSYLEGHDNFLDTLIILQQYNLPVFYPIGNITEIIKGKRSETTIDNTRKCLASIFGDSGGTSDSIPGISSKGS